MAETTNNKLKRQTNRQRSKTEWMSLQSTYYDSRPFIQQLHRSVTATDVLINLDNCCNCFKNTKQHTDILKQNAQEE